MLIALFAPLICIEIGNTPRYYVYRCATRSIKVYVINAAVKLLNSALDQKVAANPALEHALLS